MAWARLGLRLKRLRELSLRSLYTRTSSDDSPSSSSGRPAALPSTSASVDSAGRCSAARSAAASCAAEAGLRGEAGLAGAAAWRASAGLGRSAAADEADRWKDRLPTRTSPENRACSNSLRVEVRVTIRFRGRVRVRGLPCCNPRFLSCQAPTQSNSCTVTRTWVAARGITCRTIHGSHGTPMRASTCTPWSRSTSRLL